MQRILLVFLLVCSGNLVASDWKYDIAPYMWATSLKGETQLANRTVQVNEPFSKLFNYLDFGGMLWLDAYHDRFGLFFNGFYSKLSAQRDLRSLSLKLGSRLGIAAAGGSYRLFENEHFIVEPYAGARYTNAILTLSAHLGRFGISAENTEEWTDGMAGTRLMYKFNTSWRMEGGADYGAGHHSNSYNLHAMLGYQSETYFKNTRFYLGYHFLHQNFHHGQGIHYFRWDMDLYGPILGFALRF